MIQVYVKENSWLAGVAARKLKSASLAMVIGKTIHLHGAGLPAFMRSERWVKHELEHIRQTRQLGMLSFLWKYLWESARKGYAANKYEVEARAAELLPQNFAHYRFWNSRTGEEIFLAGYE